MPLVIVTGGPCTGKTRLAARLAAVLSAGGHACVIVNEESIGVAKAAGYGGVSRGPPLHTRHPPQRRLRVCAPLTAASRRASRGCSDAVAEKITRGTFKAAVERALGGEVTVIADSLNYIKGFRYELYCVARGAKTPHCCVHVTASSDAARAWDAARGAAGYGEALCVAPPPPPAVGVTMSVCARGATGRAESRTCSRGRKFQMRPRVGTRRFFGLTRRIVVVVEVVLVTVVMVVVVVVVAAAAAAAEATAAAARVAVLSAAGATRVMQAASKPHSQALSGRCLMAAARCLSAHPEQRCAQCRRSATRSARARPCLVCLIH